MTSGINPFGEPDGSRQSFDEAMEGFVVFKDEQAWGGLACRPDDLSARVIAGRQGSGKTLYLRRLRDHATRAADIYGTRRETSPPPTELIVNFAQHLRLHDRLDIWRLTWMRAILRAAVTHALSVPELRSRVNETLRHRLEQEYRELMQSDSMGRDAMGVYSELKAILTTHRSANEFNTYLNRPEWAHLKSDLEAALLQCKPVCFFLDNIDEFYETAPKYWLECQIGMFYAIMDLLRDDRFGGRLHVFATLRDIVLYRIIQNPHGLRYYTERYVRTLEWDYKAILNLVQEKIDRLPKNLLANPDSQNRFVKWLGRDSVVNHRRQVTERSQDYLLRHTRLLPRDVVILGNILCQEIARDAYFTDLTPDRDSVVNAVRVASARFGNEQLEIAALQIITDMMPEDAAIKGYENIYLDPSGGLYHDILKKLRSYIRDIRNDRFQRRRLSAIKQLATETFGSNVDVLTPLWLNGLVGYIDDHDKRGCAVFYSHKRSSGFVFPEDKMEYAFHSCLIDSVGLRGVRLPVIQCP